MELSSIVHLESYRSRKDSRLRRTLALHGHDAEKSLILNEIWRALLLAGGDRGAIVWLDEYGSNLPHAFAVLDLASDRPRRLFSQIPLTSAWEMGVPGLLDLPDAEQELGSDVGGIRSVCAIALGSDGPRSWFLVVDSLTPRPSLSPFQAAELMFLAGQCASVLLHRDLEQGGPGHGPAPFSSTKSEGRFPGWPVLGDAEGVQGDEVASARIATRFLVARVIRGFVDEDLVADSASLAHQLDGIRKERAFQDQDEPERGAWERVLDAISRVDLGELPAAVMEWGGVVEGMGHLHGAREIHAMAYDLAVASGASGTAVDSARFLGRVSRKLTLWEDAVRWYGVARSIAEEAGHEDRLALVLDGMANAHRDRGNLPKARELLGQVLALGREGSDRRAQAIAHHDLMTVEKLAGRLEEAVLHGWKAAEMYDSPEGSLKALFDLAGVLKEIGDLSAAWDAYSVVAAQVQAFDYRLLSLDGMAHIAALRGLGKRYDVLRARVEAMNWAEASPVSKAQVLLYRGLSCGALGRNEEARDWLNRALSFAESHQLSQLIFKAEKALGETPARQAGPDEGTDPLPKLELGPDVLEVRRGLREKREAVAGAGGPL